MVLLPPGSFCVFFFLFFFLVLFVILSPSNRIHLQSHLLFLHSRLYPQVVAGKRYFMFSLGKLEGLCGVGLHILTASDAGQGYSCPKAQLAGHPKLPPSLPGLVLAGSWELSHMPPGGPSGLWSQCGWIPPEQSSQEHWWQLMAFSSLISEVTECRCLCSQRPAHLQGRGQNQRVRHDWATEHMYVQRSRGLMCPHSKHRCIWSCVDGSRFLTTGPPGKFLIFKKNLHFPSFFKFIIWVHIGVSRVCVVLC